MTHLFEIIDRDELEAALLAGHVRRQQHSSGRLAILNYTEKCQYERGWNRTTKATRGLIYNTSTGDVVARPWSKFFNYGEPDAPTLDLDVPATVTDKIDGSLGILYRWREGWAVATRGSFTSGQAVHATWVLATRYADFTPPEGWTVLVEIVYPGNRIVCDYGDKDDLILLGAVEIATGRSIGPREVPNWHGPCAQTFAAKTLADALAMPPRPGAEGVVVRIGQESVKLKQDDYVRLHRIVTGLNARVVWEHLGNGGTVAELCEPLPDEFHGWVGDVARDLLATHHHILDGARNEHAKILNGLPDGWVRRDYAMIAGRSPNRAWLFMLLDGKDPSEKIWYTLRPSGDDRPICVSEDAA